VDKVETAGRKISGHGYVVGEICRTENLFPFHPRNVSWTREDAKNFFFFISINDILKVRRILREKTPTLSHLKVKIFRLHTKWLQSIIIDTQVATFSGTKTEK